MGRGRRGVALNEPYTPRTPHGTAEPAHRTSPSGSLRLSKSPSGSLHAWQGSFWNQNPVPGEMALPFHAPWTAARGRGSAGRTVCRRPVLPGSGLEVDGTGGLQGPSLRADVPAEGSGRPSSGEAMEMPVRSRHLKRKCGADLPLPGGHSCQPPLARGTGGGGMGRAAGAEELINQWWSPGAPRAASRTSDAPRPPPHEGTPRGPQSPHRESLWGRGALLHRDASTARGPRPPGMPSCAGPDSTAAAAVPVCPRSSGLQPLWTPHLPSWTVQHAASRGAPLSGWTPQWWSQALPGPRWQRRPGEPVVWPPRDSEIDQVGNSGYTGASERWHHQCPPDVSRASRAAADQGTPSSGPRGPGDSEEKRVCTHTRSTRPAVGTNDRAPSPWDEGPELGLSPATRQCSRPEPAAPRLAHRRGLEG